VSKKCTGNHISAPKKLFSTQMEKSNIPCTIWTTHTADIVIFQNIVLYT